MTKKPNLRSVTGTFQSNVDPDASFVRLRVGPKTTITIEKADVGKILPHLMTASDDARVDLYVTLTLEEDAVTEEGKKLLDTLGYNKHGAAWDKTVNTVFSHCFLFVAGGSFDFAPSVIIDQLTPQEWVAMRNEAAAVAGSASTLESAPKPQNH